MGLEDSSRLCSEGSTIGSEGISLVKEGARMVPQERKLKVAVMIDAADWVKSLIENRLNGQYEVVFVNTIATERLPDNAIDADTLVTWRATGALISSAPRLRLIQVWGAGVDQIDMDTVGTRGIIVRTTAGCMANAISEYVIMHILTWERELLHWNNVGKSGDWSWDVRNGHAFSELSDRSLGIIGLGHIGSQVAKRAKSFGMKVYAIKRNPSHVPEQLASYLDFVGGRNALPYVLRSSDYVTLHVPLTGETTHLVADRELKLMKRSAVLINTSRGAVIDENALRIALGNKWIRGASLDVTTKEPLDKENMFSDLDNVIITCHHAGFTRQSVERFIEVIRQNLEWFRADARRAAKPGE